MRVSHFSSFYNFENTILFESVSNHFMEQNPHETVYSNKIYAAVVEHDIPLDDCNTEFSSYSRRLVLTRSYSVVLFLKTKTFLSSLPFIAPTGIESKLL